MKGHLHLRTDLGIRRLLPEWRALFRRDHLREDVIAGLTVACVALPLSLAIALASGVPPAVGLVTSIVAGVVGALFGGTPLAVSGPTATMAVLLAATAERYGLTGVFAVGLACGLIQLASGVIGLGRVIRLVPVPVVEGFIAGTGAIILIGQLPRVLGLPPPEEAHVVSVVTHIGELLHQASGTAIAIALGTAAIVLGLPRLDRRLPAPLFGVAVPTLVVAALGVETATIGALPRTLPLPGLPAIPAGAWGAILTTAVMVFFLATLESLLSASAVEKLARGERPDPDQELVGQGLANVAAAILGGLPGAAVIARSSLNAQAGGRTRRASIVHALALVAVVFLFAPLVARVPIAALAGVLVAVSLRMLDPRKLLALLRVSRGDAAVYATTFVLIVLTDLASGVQWGILAALAVAAVRLGQSHTHVHPGSGVDATRIRLRGPLTFLASLKVDRLRAQIDRLRPGARAILDLSEATALDASGVELCLDLVARMRERELAVAVAGLRHDLAARLAAADHAGILAGALATTEQDVPRLLAAPASLSARQRLLLGVEHYRAAHLPRYGDLFARLARKQTPHTMLITCADSRIQPALMTSTDPGELFIVRNVGNMVPPWSASPPPSAGAALEYGVFVLGVSEIVLCAHSRCGAINALRQPETVPERCAILRSWLSDTEAQSLCDGLPSACSDDDVARLNALLQLDHVRSYPVVRERIEAGALHLRAWFFDVATGEIEEWCPDSARWKPLALPCIDATPAPGGDRASSDPGMSLAPLPIKAGSTP